MREQGRPKAREKPLRAGLFVQRGMLHRTKYSRLRNDSVTSLEDGSQTAGTPPKVGAEERPVAAPAPGADPAGTAGLRPGAPSQGPSTTLCAFIPRMANLRISGPAALLGLRAPNPRQGARHRPAADYSPCGGGGGSQGDRHGWQTLPSGGCPSLAGKAGSQADWQALDSPQSGISYQIKYMGCLEVTESMRALDFDTRMQVTREAIGCLCEGTPGAKTALRRRKMPTKGLSAILGKSSLEFSGVSVILNINTHNLTLTTVHSPETIAHHPMQSISFASGGDPDTADYVAYVAKDSTSHRACHILECPDGLAEEVINTIGQAFERRFRQFLSNPSSLITMKERMMGSCDSPTHGKALGLEGTGGHDYYNATPGRQPPPGGLVDVRLKEEDAQEGVRQRRVASPPLLGMYENCTLSQKQLAPSGETDGSLTSPGGDAEARLQGEPWFHGRLSRHEAESRLADCGDFLVRESSSAPGQYVLSGLQGSTAKHLLLVDPQGLVRTKDHVFSSIAHLIRYHLGSQRPIVSCGSALCLKQPVRIKQ